MTETDRAPTDTEICAQEPIQIPGTIQPHGVLLGIDPDTNRVVRASANAVTLLGQEADSVLGKPIEDVLPGASIEIVEDATRHIVSLRQRNGIAVDLVGHRTGGLLVIELRPLDENDLVSFDSSLHEVSSSLALFQRAKTLEELVDATAAEVRRLTGFDRVMVYRFDSDWNGEVVAEDKLDRLEPFLGLWYPASDIPAQARALYAATWLRLIVDVDAPPVPILPTATGADGEPLDLTCSVLRSVSPVHLEYLRNMGVQASMSISIMDGAKLWGLIACHRVNEAHLPPFRSLAAAEHIGQLVSLLLPTMTDTGNFERRLAIHRTRQKLAEALDQPGASPAMVMVDAEADMLDLAGATGVAIRLGGELLLLGDTPHKGMVDGIVAAVLDGQDEPSATESLVGRHRAADSVADTAAGVLAAPIGGHGNQYIAWFRPELPRQVSWGGDPNNKVVRDGDRIGPRQSFERWTETVRLRSRPWEAAEIQAADWLSRHVGNAQLRDAMARSEMVTTVQRALLLESMPDVPGVDLGFRYLPAAASALGGDWYDLVWLPNGRFVVVVGDVAGHGIGAAPAMAQLRHGLRAYLVKESSPADAITRLNDLMCQLLPHDMATVLVAEVDVSSGSVRVANAGHLPPVVVTAEGSRLLEEKKEPPLGILGRQYRFAELALDPGDTLLLYTDGLVEKRDETITDSLERLRQRAELLPADLEEACDSLVAHAVLDDDVTLLALRLN